MGLVSVFVGLVIGIVIGGIFGYVIGRQRANQPVDLSGQTAILSNLNAQVAEMRGKFVEIERSRAQLEEQRAQFDTQREERLKEWMESTRQLFAEQATKGQQVDEEKDKRIQAWMESTKKFFEEQKGIPMKNGRICGKYMFRKDLEKYLVANPDGSVKMKNFKAEVRKNPEMYPRIAALLEK